MATKMAIIDEIRKSFSSYLKDDLYVPRHVWLDPYYTDEDEIHDYDANTFNPLKTSEETNENKIELCVDRQKKDKIVDFDEGENRKSQEKSLKEEIDKTSAQEIVTSTVKTSKLAQIEDAQLFVNSRIKRIKKNPKSQEQLPNHKKKKSVPMRKKDANASKKSDNVVEPLTPMNSLQEVKQNELVAEVTLDAPPTTIQQTIADDISFIKSALELPDALMEQKTLTVNEWLQASSEVQLDNIMDEDDFDSFLLARYTEQIADESRFTSSSVTPLSQPLDLSVKRRTPLSTGFCNEDSLLDTTPQQLNDEIASKSVDAVHDFSQPLDLSVKQTTPMSTDTGFCDESFLLDSTFPYHSRVQTIQSNIAGDSGNEVDRNVWMNNNTKYTESVNDNKTDKNGNLIGVDWKMNESVEMLIQTNVKPVPSTLQNNQRGSLKPEDSSPTTKQQYENSIMKETERPMILTQECIFQSQQLPMWNTDNDSTDLDYEPYEDEDN